MVEFYEYFIFKLRNFHFELKLFGIYTNIGLKYKLPIINYHEIKKSVCAFGCLNSKEYVIKGLLEF